MPQRTSLAGGLVAALVTLAAGAGCGELGHRYIDAPVGGDDVIDAAIEIDAATGQATVRAYTLCCEDVRGPQVGAPVVVTSPTGAVRGTATTDAAGEAVVTVVDGDAVTVVYPERWNERALRTFVGAAPGDVLEFGDEWGSGGGGAVGTMTFTWPLTAGVSSFRVYAGCSSAGATGPAISTVWTHYDGCGAGGLDAVLLGYDANFNLVRWALQSNLTFTSGGTVAFGQLAPATSFTLNVTDLPAGLAGAYARVHGLVDEHWLYGIYASGWDMPTSLTAAGPWGATTDGVLFGYDLYGRGDLGYQWGYRLAPNTTSLTVDDVVVLPWLGSLLASAAAEQVSWIETAGAPYDVRIVELFWWENPGGGPAGGPSSTYTYWTIRMPPGGAVGYNALRIPRLPEALAAYRPPEERPLEVGMRLVDFAGRDAADVRALPEWRVLCPDCLPLGHAEFPPAVAFSSYGGGKLTGAPRPDAPSTRGDRPRGVAERLRAGPDAAPTLHHPTGP